MKEITFEALKKFIKEKVGVELVEQSRIAKKGNITAFVADNGYGWYVSLDIENNNRKMDLSEHRLQNMFQVRNLVNKFNRLRKVR